LNKLADLVANLKKDNYEERQARKKNAIIGLGYGWK
jgi:hypothetical protein